MGDPSKEETREIVRETVNHPIHYGGDTIYETIKVLDAWGLGGRVFHLGNAVKYLSRAGKKPGAEVRADVQKARWYIDRYLENAPDNLRCIEASVLKALQNLLANTVTAFETIPTPADAHAFSDILVGARELLAELQEYDL